MPEVIEYQNAYDALLERVKVLKQSKGINRLDLVNEELQQPHLVNDAYEALADAKTWEGRISLDVEMAKDGISQAKAKIELAVRHSPATFGLGDKPVASAVDSAVLVHETVRSAQSNYFAAKNIQIKMQDILDQCEGMVKVYKEKRESLTAVGFLQTKGLYGG